MNQGDRLIWLDLYLYYCQKSPQTRPAIVAAYNKACANSDDHITYNTMVRDMVALRAAGAEVCHDRGGWYSKELAFRVNTKRIKKAK